MTAVLKLLDTIQDEVLAGKLPPPSEVRINSIRPIKMFYCLYGRNAWHSTWVQKYSTGCMHLKIESAKMHAENRRVQGSVFYIKEMPALEIDVGPYRAFITQINNPCPLREYRINALRERPPPGMNLIKNARDCYLKFGVQLSALVLSFAHDSRFWTTPQPFRNSVMVLYNSHKIEAEPLKSTKLKGWESNSAGKDYRLWWSSKTSKVSQASVLRITRQAMEYNNVG